MVTPISDLILNVKRSCVDGKAVTMAGIDSGCSLTKAVYLPKDESVDSSTHYAFHCVLFSNDNFFECVRFLKENARLPDQGVIRVTGAGCDKHRNEISEILGLEVQFVPEHLTMISGVSQLILGVDNEEELFYPDPPMEEPVVERTEDIKKLLDVITEQLSENDVKDSLFPFILVLVGSAVAKFLVKADGSVKFLGTSMTGGKTLIGLGNCLAGAKGYDELMELAKAGHACNVDTTSKDILATDKKSAYGRFPEDMLVFPLGKIADQQRTMDNLDPCDRAASAVRLFVDILFSIASTAALSNGVSRIVIGGHGIRGEALRYHLLLSSKFFMNGAVKIRCLRTGCTGAFGAMILDGNN